jgi:ribosomal protein S18 acetylase RimI-like enzyme
MQIRQLENIQDLDDIKNLVQDLSVWKDTLQEWFQDYPIENLDYFKDFILRSPLSLWVFEDKKMIGFVVSYDISNILNIQNSHDPILQYLLEKQYLDNKSVYIDIFWIIQNMQNRWIGVRLLLSLINYIKQQEFKNIRCVVCTDSHNQNSNIYKILKYLWLETFDKITDSKWNNFWIYKADLK